HSSELFAFSFYSSRSPPHLHSFPTRRSSDLQASWGVPCGVRSRRRSAGHRDLLAGTVPDRPPLLRQSAARTASRPVPHQSRSLTDRKSTRLNSSHEWISYAVFCLKKKNTITS